MKVLLAVSGGIDSMYMANRAPELFPEAEFAVAHCNFSLRGEESDADEAFVREWCGRSGMPLHVRRFDTRAHAASKGISIEMAARELRYSWFGELCREHGYDAVATAHNANDNAETLMLNLLRGTGLRGIRGMKSRPGVLRPIIDVERAQIRAWMTERGIGWREDSSNAVPDVKRNIIRNEVFPLFEGINPSFVRTLCEDMRRFDMAAAIADDYLEAHRAEVMTDGREILTGKLLSLRHWQYLLWQLLEGSGIGREEFTSLVRALESGEEPAGKLFGPVRAASGRLVILSGEQARARSLRSEILARSEIDSLVQKEGVIIMDADKLSSPLKIRKWREGDWMRPLGMKGRKKLSDIFTGLKYSIEQKREAEVIELEGSHVAALLCVKIDEAVKVEPGTCRVLRLSYSESIR